MTDNNLINISERNLENLAEAFFNGSIPPQDVETLLHACSLMEQGKIRLSNRTLIDDLKTVQALNSYSQAALLSLPDSVAPDLESRLDSHISALAASSRRKWAWVKVGCAAACLALLATVGLKVALNDEGVDLSTPSSGIIAALPDKGSGNNDQSGTAISQISVTGNEQLEQDGSRANHVEAHRIPGVPPSHREPMIIRLPHSEAIAQAFMPGVAASVIVPSSLSGLPQGAPFSNERDLKGEVVELVAKPLDKLSQSIENMFESLGLINAVFYEAHQTASELTEDVILASADPLN